MKRFLSLFAALVVAFSATAAHAITVTVTESTAYGNHWVAYGSVAFDSSYPTGGETATKQTLSQNQITGTALLVNIPSRSGYVFDYDYTNEKILVYGAGAVASHTHTAAGTTAGHTHTATTTVTGTVTSHTATIAVATGTVGDAVTNNAGTPNSSGGQDWTTNAITATFGGAVSETTTNATSTDTFSVTSGASGAVSAAALSQVANTTNLSTLTGARYVIFGR